MVLNECNCKPNKIWLNKGSEFYNRSMKSWLQDNNIEMYSTHIMILVQKIMIKNLNLRFVAIKEHRNKKTFF